MVTSTTLPRSPAAVRPRVILPDTGDAVPLEDEVQEHLECGNRGAIKVFGDWGSGKSTALEHVGAVFADEAGRGLLQLVDEPIDLSDVKALHASGAALVLYSGRWHLDGLRPLARYRLAPWGDDDVLEYLLARHPHQCRTIVQRLRGFRDRALIGGVPELWAMVLDGLAADESPRSITDALRSAAELLLNDKQQLRAGELSLQAITQSPQYTETVICDEFGGALGNPCWRMLRHRAVQRIFAADGAARALEESGSQEFLTCALPPDLLSDIAESIASRPTAIEHLGKLLRVTAARLYHPAAASLLFAADPAWRPQRLRLSLAEIGLLILPFRNETQEMSLPRLAGASLSHARWAGIDLTGGDLRRACLEGADLERARLNRAHLEGADLTMATLRTASLADAQAVRAVLRYADLTDADATRANFSATDLSHANLEKARLKGCSFTVANLSHSRLVGADLSDATLTHAHIEDADFTDAILESACLNGLILRQACFTRADFGGARLMHCDFEAMHLPSALFEDANLRGALLTGSQMAGANFGHANLRETKLADVSWEGANLQHADLRGATFHMGSSRSGLVFSPYACEGSRTGFYTDEYHEQGFKAPEEIRKADLRRADLRGANIKGVDFYLVDLRGAQYTPDQEQQFRRCKAIL